ncbi:MAG TPA: hypothetical protein ENK26_10165 [Gammaproteobacteria bacterium]|nr:hypothetical protein [Gammaproteobacteria bacterium]
MKKIGLILVSFLLVSCATLRLWEDSSYDESISGFLLKEGSDEVFVIGDEFHYLFRNQALKNVLLSPYKAHFVPNLSNFRVNGNKVSGTLRLSVDPDRMERSAALQLISDLGFTPRDDDLTLKLFLEGKRYKSNIDMKSMSQFKHSYHLAIRKDSSLGHAGKILLTPLTVAFDVSAGVLAWGGFTVMAVVFCTVGGISGQSHGGLCSG